MPPNTGADRSIAMEAFRRRAGQLPSTAGLPPGEANLNPQAQAPQQVMASRLPQAPQPQATMSQPGVQQLQKSQPGEADIILKALISRLKTLAPNIQQ